MRVCTVFIAFLLIALSNADGQFYISKSGVDHETCGRNASDPCGTLYGVSMMINDNYDSYVENYTNDIFVVDGQNESEIGRYLAMNDGYNPCTAMPFSYRITINIHFDGQFIQNTADWFPYHLCESGEYENEYILDGGRELNVSNLVVRDYDIDIAQNRYFVLRSVGPVNYPVLGRTSISCTNCSFHNINASVAEQAGLPWLRASYQLRLHNCEFVNIRSMSILIAADPLRQQAELEDRLLKIDSCVFENIVTSANVIAMTETEWDGVYQLTVSITDTVFDDIFTEKYIFSDETLKSDATITNCRVNIASGLIYRNNHRKQAYLTIRNVNVTTAQFAREDDAGLFTLDIASEATMTSVQLLYVYDLTDPHICQWDEGSTNTYDWLNLTITRWECKSPIKFLDNGGQASLVGMVVDVAISNSSFGNLVGDDDQLDYWSPSGTEMAVIFNRGNMQIVDIKIKHSANYYFIVTENDLYIENLHFDESLLSNWKPNVLHSAVLVSSVLANIGTLTIINSHFFGLKIF